MLQNASPFTVSLARSDSDIRAAQRLRYEVFVAELGGNGDGVDHANRRESDAFDAHADHLLLRDTQRPGETCDQIVGVYRLMTQSHAKRAGGFYSDAEFDLSPLETGGHRLLELGRSCLHPAYRGSAALMALWRGIAAYARDHHSDVLFGVASFHGTDPNALSHPISHLHHTYLAPEEMRVRSRMQPPAQLLPEGAIDRKRAMRDTPALIKSYLKLGGTIGDGVFIDHAFNTTDVCLILETSRLDHSSLLPRAWHTG